MNPYRAFTYSDIVLTRLKKYILPDTVMNMKRDFHSSDIRNWSQKIKERMLNTFMYTKKKKI